MTILVLGIRPPKPDISQAQTVLPGQIFNLIPEFFIFILAFLIIASFWLDHPHQFHFVRAVDSHLLWINIFLLISLVLIPFSTDVAGDYPKVQVAVLLFHINILIVGLIFSYHLHYISQSKHLLDPMADRKFLQVLFHQSLVIPSIAFKCSFHFSILQSRCWYTWLFRWPGISSIVPVSESNRRSKKKFGGEKRIPCSIS
jgi:uncharacterized membrane protein